MLGIVLGNLDDCQFLSQQMNGRERGNCTNMYHLTCTIHCMFTFLVAIAKPSTLNPEPRFVSTLEPFFVSHILEPQDLVSLVTSTLNKRSVLGHTV